MLKVAQPVPHLQSTTLTALRARDPRLSLREELNGEIDVGIQAVVSDEADEDGTPGR